MNDYELLVDTLTRLKIPHYAYSGIGGVHGCCYRTLLIGADRNSDKDGYYTYVQFNVDDPKNPKIMHVGYRYIAP